MERHVRVQFFIPVKDNINEIDITLESIWNQDYPKDDIFITVMDFSEGNESYEKLLSYDSYHLGVYKTEPTSNKRVMVERMARLGYVNPGGWYSFQVLLHPGEKVYPDFTKVCTEAIIRNQAQKPTRLICEADLIDEFGKIVNQPPLFDKDSIVDGNTEIGEYCHRGYRHQIQTMVYGFTVGLARGVGQSNEQRWWNKMLYNGYEKMILYIRKPLVLQKRVEYDDELEELLLRWEGLIGFNRGLQEKLGISQSSEFVDKALNNIALYALWRSYELANRRRNKEAEDLLLMATVIYSPIEMEELYKRLYKFVENGDNDADKYLKEYYNFNGWA